jgi:hypothetical protein
MGEHTFPSVGPLEHASESAEREEARRAIE